ncbi:MAG TPA: bifunctional dTDP-4-dehydrorhamnose 3,5-epimerase family protein/NAD(P)-dependent oxidoreductase [Propionibacteriaceae bacterium]
MAELAITQAPIPGLLLVSLDIRADNRGWFKENWQREKMVELGLPDFTPVQNNISFNNRAGATRGIHAEPWDKLVSLATGRIFGVWVDLRAGDGFGRCFTLEIGPETAIFVPRGVGNAYQTLTEQTSYSYLVNDHWTPAARESYTFVNLADETLAINWPIPLEQAELSDADRAHPRLADVTPVEPKKILIIGAAGQLGRALSKALPAAAPITRDTLDLASPESIKSFDFAGYGVVINAAGYTKVDAAETKAGRRDAWAVNVGGVATLVEAARQHHFTLVHISSDYVFDGSEQLHTENETFSPLGVYGQTKAAGDAVVGSLPAHYVLRTSWVIGEGRNFVRTMASLADSGSNPEVVDDQFGRLTFTAELSRAITHLLQVEAPYGTYNVSNDGEPMTWADIARAVFAARDRDPASVQNVRTAQYTVGKALAPRPRHSVLSLEKIISCGFRPADAMSQLQVYLSTLD